MKKQEIRAGNEESAYTVTVGAGILEDIGSRIDSIGTVSPTKIVVFSNPTVFALYGETVVESLRKCRFQVFECTIPDGEEHKNFANLELSLNKFAELGLKRSDAVVTLGGGVVGDLAAFAASIYLRGIPVVQIPTTLLSMVDSSVGGKTGVNSVFGKNLIGTFYQPKAVFADVGTLKTLELRELRAGYYEIIKHGAIGGPELLSLASVFLDSYPLVRFDEFQGDVEFQSALIELIGAQVRHKAEIVSGDEFEDPHRTDPSSRKILNFGHTVGHALEKVTEYSYFRHGEAVGFGMLAAAEIGKRLEFCDFDSISLLNDVVRCVGGLPDAGRIDVESVLAAITFDKKSSSKGQQWVLLEGIGIPRIISGDEIPDSIIRESIKTALLN